MTAQATSTNFTAQLGDAVFPNEDSYPVAAAVKVIKGGMVCLVAGYADNANPAAAGNPEMRIVGRAEGTGSSGTGPLPTAAESDVDNTAGAAGAKFVRVTRGIFLLKNSAGVEALDVSDVGKPCYLVDNITVSRNSASGHRPIAGIVFGVPGATEAGAAGVYVQIGPRHWDRQILRVVANADLTLFQYGIVKLTAGKAAKSSAATDALFGILQNAPNINEIAEVLIFGPSFLKAGAGFTSSLDLTTDANGLGIDAIKSVKPAANVGADLVAIATADATVNGGGYVQADVNTIVTLANAIKAYINGAPLAFWNALKADRASIVVGSRTIAKALETAAGGETKLVFVNPSGII